MSYCFFRNPELIRNRIFSLYLYLLQARGEISLEQTKTRRYRAIFPTKAIQMKEIVRSFREFYSSLGLNTVSCSGTFLDLPDLKCFLRKHRSISCSFSLFERYLTPSLQQIEIERENLVSYQLRISKETIRHGSLEEKKRVMIPKFLTAYGRILQKDNKLVFRGILLLRSPQ